MNNHELLSSNEFDFDALILPFWPTSCGRCGEDGTWKPNSYNCAAGTLFDTFDAHSIFWNLKLWNVYHSKIRYSFRIVEATTGPCEMHTHPQHTDAEACASRVACSAHSKQFEIIEKHLPLPPWAIAWPLPLHCSRRIIRIGRLEWPKTK